MQQQLDFTGRELMEIGMNKAVSHADEVIPEWSTEAWSFLLKFADTGEPFMAEDVRAASSGIVPPPPSLRAWGAIFRKAAKAGVITRIGFRNVSNPLAHNTPASVWIKKT